MLSLNLAPVNQISATSLTKNMSKQYLELPSISKIKHNMTIIWCSMRISSKTPWCYKPLQCTKYIFPFKAKFTCNDAVKYVPNILDMISPPMHYARNDEPYAVVKIVYNSFFTKLINLLLKYLYFEIEKILAVQKGFYLKS